jgi:predicted permease
MAAVLAALLPVFLLIVAGFLLRRVVVDEVYWRRTEWLAYYVLFPTLFVHTLARADFSGVPAGRVGFTLASAVVLISLMCLALRGMLIKRYGVDGPSFTSLFQGATRWQTSVALAVSAALFGESGLALAAVAVVAMTPLLNVLNVLILARYASPRHTGRPGVAAMLVRNPFIWGIFAGIVINIVRMPIPEPVSSWAAAIGRVALVVGVITVGGGLRPGHLMPLRPITFVSTTLKLIVMPAAAISLGAAIGVKGVNLAVIACCSSVPSTSSAYVLARQMGGDAELIAEIITIQTILAVVTMPVAIALAS